MRVRSDNSSSDEVAGEDEIRESIGELLVFVVDEGSNPCGDTPSTPALHSSILDFPHRFNQAICRSFPWDTMGAFMSRFWFMLFPAKEYKIVVVGLDNAGKTTTLYKLHLGEVVTTHPTVGSNVEELVYKNIRFEVWDLGGQDRLRTSWATYYRGTHAVIVVIDSTDRARITIMKEELFRLLGHEDLQQSVVLVFANKQDLKDAMTPVEITDALSLHSIKNHDWHIQACSALTGDGLYDGLGWIAQHVTGKATS
ncbi:ADP-ribosylation factor-like protein 5, partial [Cucurbita argyrosperma subsp. sororia]